ncbi:MAG: hypothetical protein QXM03_12725 [Metallosphaera sp.]|uniref:hypothetical protein n=2 Tax=Sulfolobales TaxID=2281 RepID=UPI00316323E2
MLLEDLKYQVRDHHKYDYMLEVDDVDIEEISSDGEEIMIDDVITVLVPVTKDEIIEFARDNPQTKFVVYDSKTMKDITEEFKQKYLNSSQSNN